MGRRNRNRNSKKGEDEDEEEDAVMVDSSSEAEDEEEPPRRRRTRSASGDQKSKRNNNNSNSKHNTSIDEDDSDNDNDNDNDNDTGRRRSGRSNKYKANMRVPGESIRELYGDEDSDDNVDRKKQRGKSSKKPTMPKAKSTKSSTKKTTTRSPTKSRGQHNNHRRRSVAKSVLEFDGDHDDDENDADSDVYMEEDYLQEEEEEEDGYESSEKEEDETMKIQRILAVRSETRKKWREICSKMTTSEVTDGSRWFQQSSSSSSSENDDGEEHNENENEKNENNAKEKDSILEERFLVKWNQLSYLHVSWETHGDLMDQVDNAKNYMSTFFRKQDGGLLFGQDERKDGDYFDPGLVQIDRILEVVAPENYASSNNSNSKLPASWMEELAVGDPITEFGMVLDHKSDPDAFEAGAGRQFLVKWSSMNYFDSTYEFERDLMLMDQKDSLMEKLEEYYGRTKRPTRKELSALRSKAEDAKRRSYLFLGDNSRLDADQKEEQVKEYQESLTKHVFRNGGSLRDYQAEGVTWFLANYVNRRSCILADEMGLGKTLQTAAFVNLLVEKMHKRGPFLICVPLSTLAHWQREFIGWTGLNTIVYHGSAEDRKAIRENEFAFAKDRPTNVGGGINSLYLKKCEAAKKPNQAQWMATVVVTTPEMLVADDWTELSFVQWQVLVVDEAHRLKNHNSKLALTMRKEQFKFQHKLLLTGTPIQNDVKEFWTLLNFIDPDNYDDIDEFMEEYGDMKSKEKIDDLHEQIRPYILRRLKEDVEKSVPPKEETLIEVELTLSQKQYYRALYEKNVGFLHKNKKKALDGPSLNNLAMQLRKCCNHLFLLNGVEDDMREKEDKETLNEGDFVTNGSGKLVLLDKLLPRLKTDGHRVLIFSQFKIMLDILEDYLNCREYKFERIDGSITGNKRQSAIDRFQEPSSDPEREPPFVMLLSTRAGGVGINLTAADTCVIFDSDWNPQNDIQAMARCHRIGQTKSVKVYRLLTRKTYEMQMFHMSSLKMGLDQAVLTGFETGSSGEGAMTKDEVERLLRHGAYDIFNEDKAGSAEAESNDFVQQDIDSILSRRSRKIIHGNTGSGSAAAGGTFSKASFVHKTPSKGGDAKADDSHDIDINDPDFWKKMVGEAKPEEESILKPRRRNQTNYNEKSWDKNLSKALKYASESDFSDSDDSDGDSDASADGDVQERTRWGGPKPDHWTRPQVESVLALIEKKGYGMISWDEFVSGLPKTCSEMSSVEILRMSWSMLLVAFCEVATGQGLGEAKRSKLRADRKKENNGKEGVDEEKEGGLAEQSNEAPKSDREVKEIAFRRLWKFHSSWAAPALEDAIAYARDHDPRVDNSTDGQEEKIREVFKDQLWSSLQGRGWKVVDEYDEDGYETYLYEKRKFASPSAVMNEVIRIHPELQKIVIELLNKIEQSRLQADQVNSQQRDKELAITASTVDLKSLQNFLNRYSPKQLLHDRTRRQNRLTLRQKTLMTCHYIKAATELVKFIGDESSSSSSDSGDKVSGDDKKSCDDRLCDILGVDARSGLPHPLWTRKHDAVLIRSVAKHGWVDVDSNLKEIVNDKDIKWGFPFEAATDAPVQNISEQEMNNLRGTAKRAATVLNEKSTLFEVLTGFNKKLVIDSYGLTQQVEEDAMHDGHKLWRVDDRLLHQASRKTEPIQEAVDLPAKKDFVKRAKYVIQKTLPKLRSDGTASKASSSAKAVEGDAKSSESHGYIVIDQGYRGNILLAEMVRALVKGTTKASSQLRTMWQLCHIEATSLKTMLEQQVDRKKEVDELDRIMDQIALAKFATAKRSTTQGKNVLRVMLGEKPQAPRNNGDSKSERIFPVEKTAPAPGATKAKALPKKKLKKFDPPIGEKAIRRAMKKAHDYNNGIAFGFIKGKDDLGLQLTMIETYILSTFCCDGMPLVSDMDSKKSDLSGSRTWKDISKTLIDIARQQLQHSTEVVAYCKAALAKGGSQNLEEKQINALASNLSRAESDMAIREEAARLAGDFAVEAGQRLSKKCIMLMEKVRAYGTSKTGKQGTNKYENYLGPKIPKWFGKELARLAANFDILDDENKPQSWTTADISDAIRNNSDYNKTMVSAFLDKTSARQVTSQVSLLSKLRSILTHHNEKEFRTKLKRAMKQSKRADDDWEKRPGWWDDSTEEHSFLLLKKLNKYGYRKIMTNPKALDGFGAPGVDYEDMADLKLTKPMMQIRANQLVRELYAIEDHDNMLQMVAKRRKSSKKFDSLAAVTGSGSKNPSPTNSNNESSTSPNSGNGKSSSKKSTVQTGLKAFFTKKKNGKTGDGKKKKSSPAGSKRKESPSPLGNLIGSSSDNSCNNSGGDENPASPPAEKKLKKATTPSTESEDMDVEIQSGVEVVIID